MWRYVLHMYIVHRTTIKQDFLNDIVIIRNRNIVTVISKMRNSIRHSFSEEQESYFKIKQYDVLLELQHIAKFAILDIGKQIYLETDTFSECAFIFSSTIDCKCHLHQKRVCILLITKQNLDLCLHNNYWYFC